MKSEDEQLQPHTIDDQIERLAQYAQEGTLENNLNVQLIQRLQHHYASQKRNDTLQRAWESIAQRYEDEALGVEVYTSQKQNTLEKPDYPLLHEQTGKILPIRRALPRWSTLLAVAVLMFVIGGTAVIMNRMAVQQNIIPGTGGGSSKPVCLPAPTVAPKATVRPCVTATPKPVPRPGVKPTQLPTIEASPKPTPRPGATPTQLPTIEVTPLPTLMPTTTLTPPPMSGTPTVTP